MLFFSVFFGSSKKCRIVICCLINYFLFSDKPPVGPPLCHNRGTQDTRVWPENFFIKILISLEIKKYLKTIFFYLKSLIYHNSYFGGLNRKSEKLYVVLCFFYEFFYQFLFFEEFFDYENRAN